jgi:Tripartite tricarboxylate transporter TctB family
MSRRAQENLIGGILLAGFIGVIILSLDYSPRSRLVPLPMALLGAILVVVQLVWQNLRSVDELQVDVLEFLTGHARTERSSLSGDQATPSSQAKNGGAMKNLIAFAMVAALLVGFMLLGPIPAIFLFTAGYLILSGYSSWPRGLAYGAAFTIIIVVVFGYILKIPLDRSMLLPSFAL